MKRKSIAMLLLLSVMTAIVGCGNGEHSQKPVKLSDIEAEVLTDDLDEAISFDSRITSYDSVQEFSYELLKYNLEEENPVLSPLSAYLALAMAGNGAKDETLEEFHALIGSNLTSMPYEIMNELQKDEEDMIISLANSAWVDDLLTASKDYLKIIDSYFDGEVYQRELSSEGAMKDMNTWINAKTHGLIPSMLDEPLDAYSRLVLFNTIYFKGKWEQEFKGYDTRTYDFTTDSGEVISADMMQMYGRDQLYVKNDITEGIILPYKDENIVFMALKPAGNLNVREMYEKLTWEQISEFLAQEEETLCNLRLPKFKVTFEKELNECLEEMGLKKAFDSRLADLSGIGSDDMGGNLYISLVKQKAVIILDEEGTEASAATMVEVKAEGAMEYMTPPVNMYFDKPFLYVIADKESQIPLFMGIADRPSYEE